MTSTLLAPRPTAVPTAVTPSIGTAFVTRGLSSLADSGSGTVLVMSTPDASRSLWHEYLDGAAASYARHGVDAALDLDEVERGDDTALFYAALDRTGRVVAGVRAKGPYLTPEQSHALVEWEGNPARDDVASMIERRLGDGVVEMKTAFVASDAEHPGALSALLSRTALPTMVSTGARYVMATAADHVLRRWESGGGRVSEDIAPAAYPDERYRTRIMWWDRYSLRGDVSPDAWSMISRETAILTGQELRNAA